MSPIYVPGKVTLRQTWQPMDPDAAAYITAVETADGQALEEKVKIAIDNFVLGCKADGIWSAIKASCILAGARTLDGALVPLVGTAPTNYNFVAGDYDRETGLKGDGSTKYLDSNRANNADPQNSNHNALYISETTSSKRILNSGTDNSLPGTNTIACAGNAFNIRQRSSIVVTGLGSNGNNNFVSINRNTSSQFQLRSGGTTTTHSSTSETPTSTTITLYFGAGGYAAHRLAFYSIGESLDLSLLDARVTDLITAFGVAIP